MKLLIGVESMPVILSIKPEYVQEIRKGTKLYEFRKGNFQFNPTNRLVFIYETTPVNKIVGSFYISKVVEDSPLILWKKLSANAGISKEAFFEYYHKSQRGIALKISKLKFFDEPIDPIKEIPGFSAPQSFRYLNKLEFSVLRKRLNYRAIDEFFDNNS